MGLYISGADFETLLVAMFKEVKHHIESFVRELET